MAEVTESTSVQSAFNVKLTQLEKVVEYLTYHLEEHYFQVQTLQKRYEDEENRIVRDAQITIDSIFSSIKIRNSEASKKINEDFIKKTKELKSELSKVNYKVTVDTNNSLKKISSDLEFHRGKLNRIVKEMKREIIFLQDDTKIDPLNVHKKLKEKIESHRAALETHDNESQRKQELLEEQSAAAQKEIENKYMGIILDLRRQLRPPPHIRQQIIQSLKNMSNELVELRAEINRTRSNAKKVASANFTINSYKVRQMTQQMEKDIEVFNEKFDKAKILLQDTVFQLKAEHNVMVEKQNEHKAKLNAEIEQLEEELRDTDPIHLMKKRVKAEEDKIEANLQVIQTQINEIKDLKMLHEKEINELKEQFEYNKKKEDEEFEQQKKKIEEQIQIQETYEEKIKEKNELHKIKKSLIRQPITIDKISIKSEIEEINTLFKKEYAKAQIEKKATISNIFQELDYEFDKRKDQKKMEYEQQLAMIAKEYKENDVVAKVSNQYEELYRSLETQFDEIVVPDKTDCEPVTEYKRKQMDIKNQINESRQNLIQGFEDQMREEDKRFRNSSFFEDDTDYKTLILNEKNNIKKILEELEVKIDSLECEAGKLGKSARLDENFRTMKEDSQFQIKRALRQKTEAEKALISQISACSEEYSNLIHQEKSGTSSVPIVYQADIDRLEQAIQTNHDKYERERKVLERATAQKKKFLMTSFNNEKKKIKEKIVEIRAQIEADQKRFSIEREHNQVNINKNLAQKETEMHEQIPSNRSDQTLYLNNKIAQLQRERDMKKRLYNNNSGMREKEREEIDRLEIMMCDKSKLLAELGKELVIAREQCLRKENDAQAPTHATPKNPLSMSGKIFSKRATTAIEIKKPPNLSHSIGRGVLNFK